MPLFPITATALLLLSCAPPAPEEGTPASTPEPARSAARYEGPITDVHVHVFFDEAIARSVSSQDPPVAARVAERIDLPEYTAGVMVMATGSPEEVRARNDRLLAFVAEDPRRFAIASVNPHNGDAAIVELERLAERGVRWLKLHPNTQGFDVADERVGRIVARAGELGMPVTFDASLVLDADQLGKFIELAMAHPQTQIVLAHMGMARFDEMVVLRVLEQYEWWQRNLWLELSGVSHLYADSPFAEKLVWVVRKVGVDRTLFGSDYPFTTPAQAVEDVEALGFTAEELRAIFYDNANRLRGLGAPAAEDRGGPNAK